MDPEKKKPRSDSKLDSMPEHRQLELRDKLLANTAHNDLLSWLQVTCGVEVSPSALSRFFQRHCWPIIRDRRKIAVMRAEALGDAMSKDPVNWDDKIIDKTKQLAFEFLELNPDDPEAVSKLLASIIKARKQDFTEQIQVRKQELEERKVALLEQKARAADEAKKVLASKGSATEQNKLIREILK